MKDGFILYCSHYPTINKLSNEEKGKLLDAVFLYHIEGVEPAFDSFPVELAFSFLKQQFDRDQEKYLNTAERNRTNGIKGGRPKKIEEPKKPSGLIGLLKEPKKADKDKDKDKDKDNVKDKEFKKEDKLEIPILQTNKNFVIPSVSEISNYCKERKNSVDPEKFFNFYQSKGWLVGKSKMKDWRACIHTWEKSTNENQQMQTGKILQPKTDEAKQTLLNRLK